MSKENLEIGQVSKPRFEYRTFGRAFDEAVFRMTRLSVPVPEKVWERNSQEIYIISRTNDLNNTKIRDGKMDIKTFVQEVDGLEQWNPLMKGEFPMKADIVKNEVFPAFMVSMPVFDKELYSLQEFLELVRKHPDLLAVRVEKQRFGYMINNTICEYARVFINGAKVISINSESTEIDDIKKTVTDLRLEGVENINYLQAIKRIVGMTDLPLAN